MDDNVDVALAEYLRARTRELEIEHRDNLKALGDSIGTEISLDDFTPEVAAAFAGKVVEALRRWGNLALADRWHSAWEAYNEAAQRLKHLNAHHAQVLEAPLTDAERTEWKAARDGANEAEEQFERVDAEANGYLKRLDEQGGA